MAIRRYNFIGHDKRFLPFCLVRADRDWPLLSCVEARRPRYARPWRNLLGQWRLIFLGRGARFLAQTLGKMNMNGLAVLKEHNRPSGLALNIGDPS